MLLDGPAPGTAYLAAEGGADPDQPVAVSLYVYMYGQEATEQADVWTPFMTQRFPAPEPAVGGA